jgi:ABC-type antimicrobial peptide transport system permease subunit
VKIDRMDDVLAALEAPWRANLGLFSAFALMTVAIACTGLYGMLAYAVVVQRREIGIRLALGATPARIARETLAASGQIIAAGAIIGAGIAATLAPLMRSILFDVAPFDPLTLAVAPATFAAIAFAACVVPARRAARIDPAVSLRAE